MAPRNKGFRISTSANHPEEETSNRAATAMDTMIMMAEMERRMEEQRNQAAAAMEAMQKRLEGQMQVIRNENQLLKNQAQMNPPGRDKGKKKEGTVTSSYCEETRTRGDRDRRMPENGPVGDPNSENSQYEDSTWSEHEHEHEPRRRGLRRGPERRRISRDEEPVDERLVNAIVRKIGGVRL